MRLIRRSGLSYAAQSLLMAILDHDRYGGSVKGCTASLESLADDIGATPRYVVKLLPTLLDAGWVVADPHRGRTRPLRIGPACTPDPGTIVPSSGDAPANDRACTCERSFREEGTIVPTKRFPRILEEDVVRPPPESEEEQSPAFAKFFASCLPGGG